MQQTNNEKHYQLELYGYRSAEASEDLTVWVRAPSTTHIQSCITEVQGLVSDIKEIEPFVTSVDAVLPQDADILPQLIEQRCRTYYSDQEKITALSKTLTQLLNIQIDAHLYSHHRQLFEQAEQALKRAQTTLPLRQFWMPHTVISEGGEISQRTLSFYAENLEHACEQLHDHYRRFDEKIIEIDAAMMSERALHHITENDYWLAPACNQPVWIEIGALCLYLSPSKEGLTVSVTPAGRPFDELHTLHVCYDEAVEKRNPKSNHQTRRDACLS